MEPWGASPGGLRRRPNKQDSRTATKWERRQEGQRDTVLPRSEAIRMGMRLLSRQVTQEEAQSRGYRMLWTCQGGVNLDPDPDSPVHLPDGRDPLVWALYTSEQKSLWGQLALESEKYGQECPTVMGRAS